MWISQAACAQAAVNSHRHTKGFRFNSHGILLGHSNNPRSALAYEGHGVAHRVKKNYDQAIKDITKAIELNSEDAHAYYVRASIYEQLGQSAKARADRHKYNELLAGKH
jgi:Flp pilus assembly protein TadD